MSNPAGRLIPFYPPHIARCFSCQAIEQQLQGAPGAFVPGNDPIWAPLRRPVQDPTRARILAFALIMNCSYAAAERALAQ